MMAAIGRLGVALRGVGLGLAVLAWPLAGRAAVPVFKHVIIVIQENRTPDNLFGSNPTFEPGVDLATSGVTSTGQVVPLFPQPIDTCYDQAHGYPNFKQQLTQGADKVPPEAPKGCTAPKLAAFTYVDNSTGTVQPYFDMATYYGWANRMFQTNEGPSYPAHLMLFNGTTQPSADSSFEVYSNPSTTRHGNGCTGPATNTVGLVDGYGSTKYAPVYPCFTAPSLADVLDAQGISWRYYAASTGNLWFAPGTEQSLCVPAMVGGSLACTGTDFSNGDISTPQPAQILTDIGNCDLAAVSWVTPTPAASDHATDTNGSGPAWVASIVNTVGKTQSCPNGENYWDDTVIFVTWDDWGGYYDHVTPFAVNKQPQAAPGWGDGNTYGFRVPLLVVSAYTAPGTIDNVIHDFGSLLYFTEKNFNLPFIGSGSSPYTNYADYQAYARGDDMSGFFNLPRPKLFHGIKSNISAAAFVAMPPADHMPDMDDGD